MDLVDGDINVLSLKAKQIQLETRSCYPMESSKITK